MLTPFKLLLLILCTYSLSLYAQEEDTPRRRSGASSGSRSKEIQAGGGITKLGLYISVDYGQHVAARWTIKVNLAMEMAKSNDLAFSAYYFKPYVLFTLNPPQDKVHLNLAGGLIGAYSAFKDNDRLLLDSKNKGGNFGIFGGPELDITLTDAVALNAHYHQAYLPLEFMGTAMYFVGGGIKFRF